MSVKNTIRAVTRTSFNTAGLDPIVWNAVNASGLTHSCFLLRIINISKVPVSLSYDGVTEQDLVDADSTIQLPFMENRQPSNNVALIPKGTVVYVRGNGGAGAIHVVGYYQE